MRGQVHIMALLIMSFMLVSAGVLAYVTSERIEKLAKATEEAQTRNAMETMKSLISAAANPSRGIGTVSAHTVALPRSTEEVCFLSGSAGIYSPRLDVARELFPSADVVLLGKGTEGISTGKIEIEETMCVNTRGRVTFELETATRKAIVRPQDPIVPPKCVALDKRGNGMNVVFIPHGYETEEEFDLVAQAFAQDTLKEMPFSEFTINFYRTSLVEVECRAQGYLRCNDHQVRLAAKQCPHDVMVVLHKRNPTADVIAPLRSSSLSQVITINTAEIKSVLAHELGHLIGGLADEYVDNAYYTSFNIDAVPNCDRVGCEKWNEQGLGCFEGCTRSAFFRPTASSIMKDLADNDFGPIGEVAMRNGLEAYS